MKYCMWSKGGYWCPVDFGQMEIGWYINHSDKPNIVFRETKDGNLIHEAKKKIKKDEEVTIDYNELGKIEGIPQGYKLRG